VSKKSIKSDLTRLDALRDEDINYSDSPELDESFFDKATVPTLRQALIEGEDSGPAGPLDMEAIKRRARRESGPSSDNG
jgi:Arc/MetJ-type ribon-helix-helix transcriptional regulator